MHTGKPDGDQLQPAAEGVYPRAYGETEAAVGTGEARQGLPPCIRGNHTLAACDMAIEGSTPVHTGKPLPAYSIGFGSEVYPRAYGETNDQLISELRTLGLPPCIRGNRYQTDTILR